MMRDAKTLREKFVPGRAKTMKKETLKQTQISVTKQSLAVLLDGHDKILNTGRGISISVLCLTNSTFPL